MVSVFYIILQTTYNEGGLSAPSPFYMAIGEYTFFIATLDLLSKLTIQKL